MAETYERTILIAMDDGKHSDYAFQFYLDHLHMPQNHVVLLHCPNYHTISQSPMVMVDAAAELVHEEERTIRDFLEKLRQKLKDAGVGGKVKSMSGNAGEVIVKEADELGATMIVTGTRGLGAVRRTLQGSISDYIMHHSHVPVLVCRHKEPHHHHNHHHHKH